MIIVHKVLKPRLIVTFAGEVAYGILVVGYLFNAVMGGSRWHTVSKAR